MSKERRHALIQIIIMIVAIAIMLVVGPPFQRWFCQTLDGLCVFALK